jgi:hypothetical protein
MKEEEEESGARMNSFGPRFILLLLNYVEKTKFPLLIHIPVCIYIYATSRKVTGSILDGVIGFLN